MPQQFVVPQFLDVETKIIGPITGRQFGILLGTLLADFAAFRIFRSIPIFIFVALAITATGVAFAFVKINGQPFHYIVLNMIQTIRRPLIRVWDKQMSDSEIRDRLKDVNKKEVEEEFVVPVKRLEGSRLEELSMVVNTGGAYKSDALDDVKDLYGG